MARNHDFPNYMFYCIARGAGASLDSYQATGTAVIPSYHIIPTFVIVTEQLSSNPWILSIKLQYTAYHSITAVVCSGKRARPTSSPTITYISPMLAMFAHLKHVGKPSERFASRLVRCNFQNPPSRSATAHFDNPLWRNWLASLTVTT